MGMVCPWWLGYFLVNPLRRWLHDPEAILSPYVREGMTAVDIGSGMGYFTLPLAKLAGKNGRVVAVDLQEKMLSSLRRRAAKAGLDRCIETRLAAKDSLRLDDIGGTVDFVLAFAVVHEVPDKEGLFAQLWRTLGDGGHLLLSEPRGHVSGEDFQATTALALQQGFSIAASPAIKGEYTVLLAKGGNRQ